jgi:hypothetical protein
VRSGEGAGGEGVGEVGNEDMEAVRDVGEGEGEEEGRRVADGVGDDEEGGEQYEEDEELRQVHSDTVIKLNLTLSLPSFYPPCTLFTLSLPYLYPRFTLSFLSPYPFSPNSVPYLYSLFTPSVTSL